jgi:plastocyanin
MLAAAAVVVLVLAGCNGDAAEPPNDDVEADAQVDIIDNGFDPSDIEVAAGETVEWVHTGNVGHTVTFEDGEDSGTISGGDTYTRTFEESGEFPYACAIHPAMQATVTVTD